MNSPNHPSPLIPLGSLLEQKNKSRSRVKLAFFCVVGVHVVAILSALLAQGCKREPVVPMPDTNMPPITETSLPIPDTNPPPIEVASNTIPPPYIPEVVIPPVPSAGQEYAIQKGDSFYTIAKKFGVTQKAIQDANPGVDPLKLKIGKKIVIPAPAPAALVPSGVPPTADTGEQLYTVKSGDTLTTIASRHGTTVKELRALNNLTTDKITVGKKLKLPSKTSPPPAAPPPVR